MIGCCDGLAILDFLAPNNISISCDQNCHQNQPHAAMIFVRAYAGYFRDADCFHLLKHGMLYTVERDQRRTCINMSIPLSEARE
jgi:hypothetical protein